MEVLSKREIEIVRLIGMGLTSREIGMHLGISKLTVDTHRKNIARKTNTNKPSDLLRWALVQGIIHLKNPNPQWL